MPSNLKFPPSVEIKRAIAAATKAGIEIGFVASGTWKKNPMLFEENQGVSDSKV